MRSLLVACCALALALVVGWPAAAQSPDTLQRQRLQALSAAAAQACSGCEVTALQREMLTDDVAHYTARVRIGQGEYDVLEMHEVVRESTAWLPLRLPDSVFAVPGGTSDFFLSYLADEALVGGAVHRNMATFLAEGDVDVWGVSLPWALVPRTVTDFSFMKDWGVAHEVETVRIGLAIARRVRAMDGNGYDRTILVGLSDGARAGYAYLNAETQLPPGLRHVKGFVPIDQHLKFEEAVSRDAACARADSLRAQMASGVYNDLAGLTMAMAGRAAELRPLNPSPVIPGANNLQAALLIGTASYLFMNDYPPPWHWFAGLFDETGLPYGLQYVRTDLYLKILQRFAVGSPTRLYIDYEDIGCDALDVPFDDHLGEITVPVLYVGAAAGAGEYGRYSTTLLGSQDVTVHIVSLWPSALRALDFGHADLIWGTNAESLAWGPILDWVREHR